TFSVSFVSFCSLFLSLFLRLDKTEFRTLDAKCRFLAVGRRCVRVHHGFREIFASLTDVESRFFLVQRVVTQRPVQVVNLLLSILTRPGEIFLCILRSFLGVDYTFFCTGYTPDGLSDTFLCTGYTLGRLRHGL